MQALTLIQPWAHAIAHLGKDIENRTWCPPVWCLGERIAIHAGAKCDAGDMLSLCLRGFVVPERPTASAVVATARLIGWARDNGRHSTTLSPAEAAAALRSQWYVPGQVGWVLCDVQPFREPIPCKGARRLWTLPFAVVDAPAEQNLPAADGVA